MTHEWWDTEANKIIIHTVFVNGGSHFHSERTAQAVVGKINYIIRRTRRRQQLGSFLGNSAGTSCLTKTREREMQVVTSGQILNLFCQ